MKILQLVQKPQRRGAETFTFQLSEELRRQNCTVQIAYLYPYLGPRALSLGVKDQVLNGDEAHPLEKVLGFHPRLLYRLLQLMKEFQPDVVQLNGARTVKYGAFTRYFYPNGQWALIYRNIGHPQDWVRGQCRYFFYQKLVMPRMNGVVSISQITLQSIKNLYLLPVPMTYIPHAVNPLSLSPSLSRQEVRSRTRTPLQSAVILFVGNLSPEKRPDRLLRVVRNVLARLPDLYLWVVGDGPLRRELERQVEAAELTDKIRFLGVQADVAAYMNAADLFLLTSDTEGVPLVILEAGFVGLPVVSTRVGGMSECVLDGETGCLVGAEDEAGLAQAVLNLLRQPQKRAAMGTRVREWVRANFTIDIVARQYLEFYRKVLQSEAKTQNVA